MKQKNTKNFYIEDGDEDDVGSSYMSVTPIAHKIELYINGAIKSPGAYAHIFNVLRNANDDDVVIIYLNSIGGNSETAIQFREVINTTAATVICFIEGNCFSAASMIALACDFIEISSGSIMMVHNYSGSAVGKGGELFDQVSFTRAWSEDIIRTIYKGFLTDDEIIQVLAGKDMWYNYEQAKEKISFLMKSRNPPQEDIKEEPTKPQTKTKKPANTTS